MASLDPKKKQLIDFASGRPLFRARDLAPLGLQTATLSELVKKGLIERIDRGIYRHIDAPWDENLNLSTVLSRVPRGVVALISALQFHQIGTQVAHRVWLQLPQNAVTPRLHSPDLEIIRTSLDQAFTEGIKTHNLNGIEVPITTPARTIADCFKHRNKLGTDVCVEALRETIRSGVTPAEIMPYAKMNRVQKIITPYLESLQ